MFAFLFTQKIKSTYKESHNLPVLNMLKCSEIKEELWKKLILKTCLNADEFQKYFICVLIYLNTYTISKKSYKVSEVASCQLNK